VTAVDSPFPSQLGFRITPEHLPKGRIPIVKHFCIVIALNVFVVGCGSAPGSSDKASPEPPPFFQGMGPHRREISTSSLEAQRYFNQALTWTFAFNHDEAIRSYEEATRLDPDCAMAWWGIALCNGPHINNAAMDDAHSASAWKALKRAEELKSKTNPKERALIEALAARYVDPAAGKVPHTPDERKPLERGYADAMAKVYKSFPDDTDVASLYAESLMDLWPWDIWAVDGTPRPDTPEILRVLEKGLAQDPDHPGLNHLYIHAVEGSHEFAAKGVPSADKLRTLVPASGHLVHMAGHIDVRVGQWKKAQEQNRNAIKIDQAYRKISPHQGFYNIYMAHNHQFLSWACMHAGRKQESLAAARAMMESIPKEFIEGSPAAIDGYLHLEIEALLRFGEWDRVLAMEEPPATLPIKRSFWRFARATSLAAKKDFAGAEKEQAAFREAVKAVPADAKMAINKAHKVLPIAEHALAGELAYQKGNVDEAVTELAKAVELEDQLQYIEPPDWVWPVRHTLGAVLVSAGRYAEAEKVYRDDLKEWPENGWSLYGLLTCLKAKNSPEVADVDARFRKVWADADIPIASTCLCVPGKTQAGGN